MCRITRSLFPLANWNNEHNVVPMNYSINLVQRGVTAQNHPVNGRSGKLYGQAVQSPGHGGVAFAMSIDDYMANAHDLIGNLRPGQQWVPEVAFANATTDHGRCDRCNKPAVARWGTYLWCEEHAPDNAVYIDGNGATVGERRGHVAPPPAPDVQPRIVEPISSGVKEPVGAESELPREEMAAPSIGTDREDLPPEKRTIAHVPPGPAVGQETAVAPRALPTPGGTPTVLQPPPVGSEDSPTPQKEAGKTPTAVAVITDALVDRLTGMLPDLISKAVDEKLQHLAGEPKTATEIKKPAPKKAAPKKAAPQSEFAQTRARAKELGINSFGKNAQTLKAEIAAKENPPAADDDIPF